MRTARRAGERTRWYVLYAVVGAGGAAALWFGRDTLFGLLGRSADLTGREEIWQQVLERASQHPLIGWGFATPWLPQDPRFDGWRSEEHTSELQSLMRISYAVFR